MNDEPVNLIEKFVTLGLSTGHLKEQFQILHTKITEYLMLYLFDYELLMK